MDDFEVKRKLRWRADSALLAATVVWGFAFIVQRLAAFEIGPLLFNGLRFLCGALVLLPIALYRRKSGNSAHPLDWNYMNGILGAGVLLLGGAAMQQLGLRFTTAGNAGFITGLYVVLIPLILAFGMHRKVSGVVWGAVILSAAGLFLLSTGGRLHFNLGDGLELVGAVLWSAHVLLIDRLVKKVDVLTLSIGQYFVCGALSTGLGLLFEANNLAAVGQFWWAILYAGVISVGLGYTLQVLGQREAPPADAAILLSGEAVFAALFGWLFLDERMNLIQISGCGLMLVGMVAVQIANLKNGGSAEERWKAGLKDPARGQS